MKKQSGVASLPAALALIAVVAAVVAGALAASGLETNLAQRHIATAQALAAADGCVSHALSGLPVGWDFAEVLRGPDGRAGTSDDGHLTAPAGCTAVATGIADRLIVSATAAAGGGRRTIQAVVGHETDSGFPTPLWAADANTLAQVDGPVRLAVAGSVPAVPAVAAPLNALALDDWLNSHLVTLASDIDPPEFAQPPPLAALATRARIVGVAPATALGAGAPVPMIIYASGDLTIDHPLRGAGLLVVDGRLRISAAFAFDGVVAAVAGVDLDTDATLTVQGSLWIGSDPTLPALARGTLALTYDPATVVRAAALLPLPRRPKLLSLRDYEG